MRKSSRLTIQNQKLDFKIFNSTGEKVYETNDQEENCNLSNLFENLTINEIMPDDNNAIIMEESIISDEIDDHFNENQLDTLSSVNDINECLKNIETLRQSYRKIHKELQFKMAAEYTETYGGVFTQKMDNITRYIMNLKAGKKDLNVEYNLKQDTSNEIMQRKTLFLMEEVSRKITTLQNDFMLADDESDEEIRRRKSELVEKDKQLETLSSTMKEVFQSSNEKLFPSVDKLCTRYEILLNLKTVYAKRVNDEMKEREVDKKKAFNTSILNIKLQKFKGYDSDFDIYTFKSEFEKLYLESTPTTVLPDLLKNNFLDGKPLVLVKNVDNIAEIWARLKEAYGDCKIMLSKKLSEFSKIEAIWKSKSTEKTISNLSSVVNIMKDLIKLAKKHKIEQKLYHGNGLDQIFKLLGDDRLMRWLSISCEDQKEGEEEWQQLIKFLEKEIRVNQQKFHIQSKTTEHKSQHQIKNRDRYHYNSDQNEQKKNDRSDKIQHKCFICGDTNHVKTNGPGGMKLTQYFVCRKFVEMTPTQRFHELLSKDYCFQCLFPGANVNKGKHKDGTCQVEFACKHTSHDQYQRKKHVLCCEEHKNTQENQNLLQQFKTRCIMRSQQNNLPLYSQDIQLVHHTDNSSYRSQRNQKGESPVNEEGSAIYMLQTIEIDQKTYSVFYDSGFGNFISRYDAIKNLGSRATQICPGPIRLGGVGGISTETPHGIHSVKIPLKFGGDATMSGICMDRITTTFPNYPLSEVAAEIKDAYLSKGRDLKELPSLPQTVEGNTDFMIGIE